MHAQDPDRQAAGTRPRAGEQLAPKAVGGEAVSSAIAGGGPLSAAALLALQRAVGNAAVADLVQRARHEHGADCGHPQQESAPVQRSAVHEVLSGAGRPLDQPVRQEMESRLGADFSDVRVHTGTTAQRSAAEIGARAYTAGNRIVIGEGGADKHTLAHELTHVIQQRQGPVAGTPTADGLSVSDPGDRFERAAEANATRAMALPTSAAAEQAPVQRAVDPGAAGPVAVQRVIKVTPGMYAQGIGATAQTMTQRQMLQYVLMVVQDEVKMAVGLPSYDQARHKFAARLKQVRTHVRDNQVADAYTLVTALVTDVNAFLRADENLVYTTDYYPAGRPEGRDASIPRPNAQTRYATTPAMETGYEHTPLPQQPEEPRWGDDEGMRASVAQSLGPVVSEEGHPQSDPRLASHPRGGANLPLTKLTWPQATTMLPRPLLNLLFDVRFQLEAPAGSPVVIDERTPDEQARQVKSPNEPGTLRSWHQDDYGRLPDTGFAGTVPDHGDALHQHYTATSQSGAGSSTQNAATGPRGLAEYTATGSNWEHNTKVVLDYINKRVYLTVTHYQYWGLIPGAGGGAWEFFQSSSQKLTDAQGALAQHPRGGSGILLSPWVEITLP
ncbi:DUF4157 domain-containing protein [Kitasatospora sp. NPDC058965]|uniref:eCIS core domain-containing protein n=1 Tax=Kitasatospora sp. NPDC058965 TaxID=3346682 RepID=UPI0036A63353